MLRFAISARSVLCCIWWKREESCLLTNRILKHDFFLNLRTAEELWFHDPNSSFSFSYFWLQTKQRKKRGGGQLFLINSDCWNLVIASNENKEHVFMRILWILSWVYIAFLFYLLFFILLKPLQQQMHRLSILLVMKHHKNSAACQMLFLKHSRYVYLYKTLLRHFEQFMINYGDKTRMEMSPQIAAVWKLK